MVAYFLFSNGTALIKSEVELMISAPEHAHLLDQLGLMYIVSTVL